MVDAVGWRRVTAAAAAAAGVVVAVFAGGATGAPGDLDPGFGGRAHGRVVFDMGVVKGLAAQRGGGLVTVGDSGSGSSQHAVAARFKPDGTRDQRFGTVMLPGGPGAHAYAAAAVAQPNRKIVVVGYVTDVHGLSDFAVWRLWPSGQLDTSFGHGGSARFGDNASSEYAEDVTVDARGRIVLVGETTNVDDADLAVARLTPSGQPDPGFNQGSYYAFRHAGLDGGVAIAVQPDGEILVGGSYMGAFGNVVYRVKPGSDTTPAALDLSFGDAGKVDVTGTTGTDHTDIALTPDGHILILEQVPPSAGGPTVASVVRLDNTGQLDGDFGSATGAPLGIPGVDSYARALTVSPHGRVVVVGSTTDGRSFVARLTRAGEPDRTMGPNGVKSFKVGELVDVVSLPDGRLVTAGNVTPVERSASHRNVLYRLRGDLKPPSCHGRKATIVGTKAGDTLVGTKHADVIAGLGGDDAITGLGKGDVICGGPGADHLTGGAGPDHLIGGPGRDSLKGGPGIDIIRQ
jgi:uncharacterized delta-60 repeat protein